MLNIEMMQRYLMNRDMQAAIPEPAIETIGTQSLKTFLDALIADPSIAIFGQILPPGILAQLIGIVGGDTLEPVVTVCCTRYAVEDDNNRLNPDGEGWVVRAWLELNAPEGSEFILREVRDDPSTETRIPLHPRRQLVLDTERLYHVVHNPGPNPRYALITSFESGDTLDRWIASQRLKAVQPV